jgi:hypothetical protein
MKASGHISPSGLVKGGLCDRRNYGNDESSRTFTPDDHYPNHKEIRKRMILIGQADGSHPWLSLFRHGECHGMI